LAHSAEDLIVYYGYQIEDFGSVVNSPWNREQFIEYMKIFAPNAEFDI